MRTGDTPEVRILCTRFLPSDERVVFVLLFARGRWVVFVRCVIFGMKKELRSRNLLKNHALSQAISDVGWRKFLNMLTYKSKLYGKEFITIDPKYTTQRCHQCGTIMGHNGYRKLRLTDREWVCPMCQTHHIRDWNAAINIIEKAQGIWSNPIIKKKKVA